MPADAADPSGLVRLVELSADDAVDAIKTLLEHGLAADIETGTPTNVFEAESRATVLVFPADRERAAAVLGLDLDAEAPPEPSDVAAASDDEIVSPLAQLGISIPADEVATGGRIPDGKTHVLLGGRVTLTTKQLVTGLVVYLVALIVLPLVFFFGTQKLLEQDTVEPTIPMDPVFTEEDMGPP